MSLDTTTIKSKKDGPAVSSKKNWNMFVDGYCDLKFLKRFGTKDGKVEPNCEMFHKWRQQGLIIHQVQMDNTRENKLLEQRACSVYWKLPIKFTYTACNTSQQNHKGELTFATCANWG